MVEAAQILVRTDVDLKTFREEIRPAAQPWPAVRAGATSTPRGEVRQILAQALSRPRG